MSPLIETVSEEHLSSTVIQTFYAGTNVLITGSTGFLGRLLVEKLLRSCPDIGNVYLLVREKKGKSLHERIEELLEDTIFDGLKKADPKFCHKISAIEGDITLPQLGINHQDRKLLTAEVSVVFHVAATVNFNEKLKRAIPINVCGTQSMMKLCKEMVNLKAVLYVSTAYSNCVQDIVEEKIYPSPTNPQKLILFMEIMKDDVQDEITKSLLGDFPNTYTYTKAVAESVVLEEGNGLPVAVFRPAIVTSTYKEPIKGWVNNFYGPTGVVAGAFAGVIRSMLCDKDAVANIVPADMTVNAMVAIPWDVNGKHLKAKEEDIFEVPVYNFESSSQQPITWSLFMRKLERYGIDYPTVHAVWYYFLNLTKHSLWHFISIILLHYVPAILGDVFLISTARKPRLVKFYRKIDIYASVIAYFSNQNFKFKSTKVQEMISDMSGEDKKLFFCDLKKLDWDEYFKTYILGIRVYLLKDPLSTLPEMLSKWRRFYCYNVFAKAIVYVIIFWFIWLILSYAHSFISQFL